MNLLSLPVGKDFVFFTSRERICFSFSSGDSYLDENYLYLFCPQLQPVLFQGSQSVEVQVCEGTKDVQLHFTVNGENSFGVLQFLQREAPKQKERIGGG